MLPKYGNETSQRCIIEAAELETNWNQIKIHTCPLYCYVFDFNMILILMRV